MSSATDQIFYAPISVLALNKSLTRPINFENVITRIDADTKLILSNITTARQAVYDSFANAPSEQLTSTQQYLPHLYSLIQTVLKLPEGIELGSFKTAWTSSFSTAYNTSYLSSNQWHFETVFMLLSYAMAHRERACEIVRSVTTDESFESQKQEVTKLLCIAAGIFDYIKDVELARWGEKPSGQFVEKSAELYVIMSTICLAEAQQLAIKFAGMKNMDPATIAKLCIDVRDKYRYVESIARQLPSLQPKVIEYSVILAAFYELLAHKNLARKQFAARQFGLSISYLRGGLDKARVIQSTRINAEDLREFSKRINEVIDETERQHESELRTNITCYHDPMPDSTRLELPFGHSLAKPTQFTPPEAHAFTVTAAEGWSCAVM